MIEEIKKNDRPIETTVSSVKSLFNEIEYCIQKGNPHIKIEPFGTGYKVTAYRQEKVK